ncbi:MAG: hypothetical protein WCA91_02840 [Candidatus Acidiferrales bacterium]
MLVFTALLIAVLTWLVEKSGNAVQYAVQSDANARIEEAKKGAAEAHATAKQLDSDLAAEKGKVAGLQKDAANAKAAQQRVEIELSKQKELTARVELALENERAKLAPRRITASQEDVLVSELKGKVEKLFLVGRDEQEPRQYADQFISAIRHLRPDKFRYRTVCRDSTLYPAPHYGYQRASAKRPARKSLRACRNSNKRG